MAVIQPEISYILSHFHCSLGIGIGILLAGPELLGTQPWPRGFVCRGALEAATLQERLDFLSRGSIQTLSAVWAPDVKELQLFAFLPGVWRGSRDCRGRGGCEREGWRCTWATCDLRYFYLCTQICSAVLLQSLFCSADPKINPKALGLQEQSKPQAPKQHTGLWHPTKAESSSFPACR